MLLTRRKVIVIKAAIWLACLAPLAVLALRAFNVAGLSFSANPVEDVLNVCGKTALNLLILTLCITPIRRSTGVNRLVAFRRLLGLFSFFYLVLHFSTYALLDLGLAFDTQFAWNTLVVDITERPYITVGFTALVLMIPLAVTSTSGWQRRLGRKWTTLHRLVYAIAILGVVHYWWQTKLDVAEPLLYAFLLFVLLGARVLHSREMRRKRGSVHPKAGVTPAYQRVEPP